MADSNYTKAWVHRMLIGASTTLAAYGAMIPAAEACPIFRGCYEGCVCSTWMGDGYCKYDVTHNQCACDTWMGLIHTYACQS